MTQEIWKIKIGNTKNMIEYFTIKNLSQGGICNENKYNTKNEI